MNLESDINVFYYLTYAYPDFQFMLYKYLEKEKHVNYILNRAGGCR